MTADLIPPPGIRVVRVLARDDLTEQLLVHIETGEGAAPAEIIRARGQRGMERIRRAIAALDRLQASEIGDLLDVLGDAHGPAILLTHRRGAPIAQLLTTRTRWQAGEAVAVLAPLVDAVERMHEAGVAHGAIGGARVIMTEDGPSLVGFDSAELFPPEAPEVVREAVDAVIRDREAVRRFAQEVLGRVVGARMSAAFELSKRVGEAGGPQLGRVLSTGLLQLAAAVPIAVDDIVAGFSAQADEPHVAHAGDSATATRSATLFERILTGAGADALYTAGVELIDRARSTVSRMSLGRRRLVVGGGASVVLAGLVLAVLPPTSEAPRLAPAADEPVAATSDPSQVEGESIPEPGSGDDPAAATVELLELRETCFRELSLLCLDRVDQLGSTALASDRKSIIAMRDGGESGPTMADAGNARVVERLGDSALVEVGPETAPASLLVMRSEAGWRIRDWVAGG